MTGEQNLDRRIETVNATIDALEKFWFRHPELRLGQILANVAGIAESGVFHLTDEALQVGLHLLQARYDGVADGGART